MTDVAITVKLTAGEFQTLRSELDAHLASLRAGAKQAREAGNQSDARTLLQREGSVAFLREKLG